MPASFNTISKAAEFLKRHPVGEVCKLEGPSAVSNKFNGLFAQRGVYVSCSPVSGDPPSRLVTLITVDDWRVQQLKEYKASQAAEDSPFHSRYVLTPDFDVGETRYIEGNHATLVRQIRKHWGAGSYSLMKSGTGWHLKRNR